MHYNWHRHYDPTTGRYLQPDPLIFDDGAGGVGGVSAVLTGSTLLAGNGDLITGALGRIKLDAFLPKVSARALLPDGPSIYGYARQSPLVWSDPSGLGPRQLDSLSEECKALAKKIDDIRNDIEKRRREYEENPGNLPESKPGGKPRESREGHLEIIKELEQVLAQRLREYAEKCGGGGQQCPSNNSSAINNFVKW